LKEKEITPKISSESLFGAYKAEETAEDIIAEIKNSKTFIRQIESF